ncbi:MAG: AtpZ/AtpI family protein [Phenylobacterium sp.]
MPQPDDPPASKLPDEALKSLDQRLGAAEAAQARKLSPETHAAMAQGYRFVGEVVGGVLGGVGLGWLLDRFAHTAPWGVVSGLLIGSGFSIFVAVSTAARANRKVLDAAGPARSVPDDDEDED